MSDELKAGDLVVLKSGGPTMTMGEPRDGKVTCYWFVGSVKYDSFLPLAVIKRVDGPRGCAGAM